MPRAAISPSHLQGRERQAVGMLAAYLNMDMIGRLKKNLVLQGLGSSDWWAGEIEKRNAVTGLPSRPSRTVICRPMPPLLPARRAHPQRLHRRARGLSQADRHRRQDQLSRHANRSARFMALVARSLATGAEAPDYKEQKRPDEGSRGGMRVYLGTIPDYSQGGIEGVKLSGVRPSAPPPKPASRPATSSSNSPARTSRTSTTTPSSWET